MMAIPIGDLLTISRAMVKRDSCTARDLWLKQAWDAYEGNMEKPLEVYPELNHKNQQRNIDDNVLLDFAAMVVDEGVNALIGKGVQIGVNPIEAVEGEESPDISPAELAWNKIAQANQFDLLLHKTAISGSVTGHVYWKLLPSSSITGGYPRIVNWDTANVITLTNPDDKDEVWEYQHQWISTDDEGKSFDRLERICRVQSEDIDEHWQILNYRSDTGKQKWELIDSVDWTGTFGPILDIQNLPDPRNYYGVSDLKPTILDLAHAINRIASIINRVARLNGFPRMYGVAVTPEQLKSVSGLPSDRVFAFPNEQARLEYLELQASIQQLIEVYDKWVSAFHAQSKVPEIVTGKIDKLGPLSGLAMQILYAPIEMKTFLKRLTYGILIKEAVRRLLILSELPVNTEDLKVDLHWSSIVPRNIKEEAESNLLKQDIGVSTDTLLEEMGYDAEEESQKREIEKANNPPAPNPFDRMIPPTSNAV